MMLCRLGLHKWMKWTTPRQDEDTQYRHCLRCGMAQRRQIEMIPAKQRKTGC